jgi:hypothetical protein
MQTVCGQTAKFVVAVSTVSVVLLVLLQDCTLTAHCQYTPHTPCCGAAASVPLLLPCADTSISLCALTVNWLRAHWIRDGRPKGRSSSPGRGRIVLFSVSSRPVLRSPSLLSNVDRGGGGWSSPLTPFLSPPTSRPETLDTQKGATHLAAFQTWKVNTDTSQDA